MRRKSECVCVCERERERAERGNETESRHGERSSVSERNNEREEGRQGGGE